MTKHISTSQHYTKYTTYTLLALTMVPALASSDPMTLDKLKSKQQGIYQLTPERIAQIQKENELKKKIYDELVGEDYYKQCQERNKRVEQLKQNKLANDPIIKEWQQTKKMKQKELEKKRKKQTVQQRLNKFSKNTTDHNNTKQLTKPISIEELRKEIKVLDEAIKATESKLKEETEASIPETEKQGLSGMVRNLKKEAQKTLQKYTQESDSDYESASEDEDYESTTEMIESLTNSSKASNKSKEEKQDNNKKLNQAIVQSQTNQNSSSSFATTIGWGALCLASGVAGTYFCIKSYLLNTTPKP